MEEYLRGVLGFKGERGYSAYEIAVQKGYAGTEQDWLAELGTSSHYTKESFVHTATENQTSFDLPENYTNSSFIDIYVEGSKLNSNKYVLDIDNKKINLVDTQIKEGAIVEIVLITMRTNNLPIVDKIDENSTNNMATGAKLVYDYFKKIVAPNAGAHNAIYRGEDITELFYNGTLSEQIATGTFDDIFIGDYIIGKTSGRKYLVADINYRLNCGDTVCTTPHVLMIPEKIMGTAQMNTAKDTTGGYVGTEMYTTHLATYKNIIKEDFGAEHILTHRNFLANAVTDGYESGGAWFNSDIDLMNEFMLYGNNMFHNTMNGTSLPANYTVDKTQLAIFKYRPDLIIASDETNARASYWLRDVVSASYFAYMDLQGISSYAAASFSFGVRPSFLVY